MVGGTSSGVSKPQQGWRWLCRFIRELEVENIRTPNEVKLRSEIGRSHEY
jgi:hypothetical protein